MTLTPVRNIVIVGGGTAGWMTAAALSKLLNGSYQIRLIESDEIGIIGVGEATIPNIKNFNQALEIDEDEFLRATQGSFKLGIEFVNWGGLGDRYTHGFGKIGQDFAALSFHHYWLRMRREGRAGSLDPYSINTMAPHQAKFMRARPDMPNSPLADIAYAFHFDASLYARFLRGYAEQRGVKRTEGKVTQVLQREPDGHISALVMESGEKIEGDFFIDCSGIRGLLIEQTLHSGYEDWQHWLPCDRAIAVPCASAHPLLPMTRSTAHTAGWQWRIPLQHRTGNGHVFSSAFMAEDEASAILMANLDGPALAEPRTIRFATGRRKQFWNRNCVAVGLASGFLEPLESTSIHLIQTAIARIVAFFPHAGFEPADIQEYNAQTQFEYERIRDFIILHYHATERDDSPFWNYVRTMSIPDTLQHKMDLFRANARIFREGGELFAEMSWLQVMQGQRIEPRGYHPMADLPPRAEVIEFLDNVETVIRKCVAVMPTHEQFIATTARRPDEPGRWPPATHVARRPAWRLAGRLARRLAHRTARAGLRGALSPAGAQTAASLNVATYNLRLNLAQDGPNAWPQRKEAVKALIRYHEFDIVGTQEGLPDQIDDLAAMDGFAHVGVGRDDGKRGGEFAAIFYRTARFALEANGDFWLSQTPDRPSMGWDAVCCKRIASWARLHDRSTGKRFYVFNAHFDHQGELARRESAQLMLRKIREIAADAPVVFLGDLNSTPETVQVRALQAALRDARAATLLPPYGPVGTFNDFKLDAPMLDRIDYVFVSPQWRVLKYAVLSDSLDRRYPSDHHPVAVRLALD